MSEVIFLSHLLSETTPGYGGRPAFSRRQVNRISAGASSNSQEWTLSNHIGTHIDLPAHFDDSGRRLESYSAKDWIFSHTCLLQIPAQPGQIIGVSAAFEAISLQTDFLILKTGFQTHRETALYWQNNPGLSPELGQWLRQNRPSVKCVGFDFISLTAYSDRPLGRVAHRAFLAADGASAPLCVVEDMKLDELNRAPRQMFVSPLMVDGADGAPVCVIAVL